MKIRQFPFSIAISFVDEPWPDFRFHLIIVLSVIKKLHRIILLKLSIKHVSHDPNVDVVISVLSWPYLGLDPYLQGVSQLTLTPLGGGGQRPPRVFSQIAPEVLGISLWNLSYLSGQQFHTLCQKIRTQVIKGQPWVTSEWRHVSPILINKMGLRNRRHWCSFKATINWLIWNDVELVGLQNCYLGFSKFWKFGTFSKKVQFFFFSKQFPPKSKFSKTVTYVRG